MHGVVIGSAIACGRIAAVDAAAAEALPGMRVITPPTALRLKPLPDKVELFIAHRDMAFVTDPQALPAATDRDRCRTRRGDAGRQALWRPALTRFA